MKPAAPEISVIIPTHNPDPHRIARTIAALKVQTLPPTRWELIIVDNGSAPALSVAGFSLDRLPAARVVAEPELGLTAARRRGLRAARAASCVFVDDDNVLAPDYLAFATAILSRHPKLGCVGGKSLPEFESTPPLWAHEFFPLLALRDLGDTALQAHGVKTGENSRNQYPECAPIGAGMVVRRAAIASWLNHKDRDPLCDRRGTNLSSSGDNDIVLAILRAGWSVGYFPELRLTHLIPAERLQAEYLGRLNRGVQESWMRVLRKYDANPWSSLTRLGATVRQAKAWFVHQAWLGDEHRVRWEGACGHFAGRVNQRP